MGIEYAVKKLGQTIATIFFVLTFNFFLFRILPGNPFALLFRGPGFSRELLNQLNSQFGLNQPLWLQYVKYLQNTLVGNLGISYVYRTPVLNILIPRLWNTVILLLTATAISVVLGIGIGLIAGWRRGGKIDLSLSTSTLLLYSMPTFWLGLILLFVGVIYFGLPVSGMVSLNGVLVNPFAPASIVDLLRHMVLPCLTLVLGLTGEYVLIMKGSLLDVFTEDYMLTARAKGISNSKLLRDHAFKNAALPMTTLIAINVGLAVGGAIQTETIFTWPGIGLLTYQALLTRDYPVLQGCFLVLAIAVILMNFLADLLYGYLDPRIRTG
jgi:peptide/nickel transport system permease protein